VTATRLESSSLLPFALTSLFLLTVSMFHLAFYRCRSRSSLCQISRATGV
jgi:hypothetical protein